MNMLCYNNQYLCGRYKEPGILDADLSELKTHKNYLYDARNIAPKTLYSDKEMWVMSRMVSDIAHQC